MSQNETDYQLALMYIKNAPSGNEPNNTQKLQIYALFKQIQEGQCKQSAPSKLKFVERAKYDEWKKLGQMSKEQAMSEYVRLITLINPNWKNPTPKL